MKRIVSISLVLALMTGGLTSCNSTSGESDNWMLDLVSSSQALLSGETTTEGAEEPQEEETLPEEPEDIEEAEEIEAPETPEIEEQAATPLQTETPTPTEIPQNVEDSTEALENHEGNQTASSDTSETVSASTSTESAVTSVESARPAATLDSIKKMRASSELVEESNLGTFYHLVDNLFDGSNQTAWVEDIPGNGMGEWVEFDFNDAYTLSGVEITNGYQKSETTYLNNGRVEWLKFTFSDGSSYETFLDDAYGTSQRVDFPTPVDTTSLRIEIISVYPGALYQDTCITEIRMY